MIYRNIYTAQLNDGISRKEFKEALEKNADLPKCVVALNIMCWKSRAFLYYECRDEQNIKPTDLFGGMDKYLRAWPGEAEDRLWIQMYDVFHYNRPIDDEEWMRHAPSVPFCMLMRIKPDMLGSYIFYHQQMQEETPGCGNKYGVICMHENLLLFYTENPDYPNSLCFEGKLKTNNSPKNWHEIMGQHFMPWEDTEPAIQWRTDIELIYHFETIVPLPEKYKK